jgi:peptidoglycan hydrolase CwlO-like protein
MRKIIFPILSFILLSFTIQAQVIADSTATDPSLRGQYQLMLAKSKTINGYKLVNPSRITAFWKNLQDTLYTERKQLQTTRLKIKEQEKSITELKAQISGKESSLASTNARVNEISFLGMSFTKSGYNTTVWTLIIGLAATLTFIILRSAKHIHEAKYRSTLYEEISQEYQNYKTKANDKEKKLARELQDERNKLDEMKNRGK